MSKIKSECGKIILWINTTINNKKVVIYCFFFIILLFSINADAMNYSSAWVRLTLVYYKNFPYHEINSHEINSHEINDHKVNVNTGIEGCILRTDSAGSHHTLWHCKEKIYLLRPLSEVASWHKEQGHLKLKFSAFKINHIRVKITSFHILKNAPDLSAGDHMPVTGIFITHAPVVEQYKFRHISTGRISTIRATPDHPFYLQDSGSFVPIAQLSPANNLLNDKNEIIRIIRHEDHVTNRSARKYAFLPAQVYNLEIYKKHAFYAGSEKILVHNCTSHVDKMSTNTTHDNYPDFIPYNHISDNEVEEGGRMVRHLTKGQLSADSIEAILNRMGLGRRYMDMQSTAFYALPEAEYNFENDLLKVKFNGSVEKSSEQLGEIMGTAQEFKEAKTIFIINNGLGRPQQYSYEQYQSFINYFDTLAKHTDKNVIYNIQGDIYMLEKEGYPDTKILAMYDNNTGTIHPNGFEHANFIFARTIPGR